MEIIACKHALNRATFTYCIHVVYYTVLPIGGRIKCVPRTSVRPSRASNFLEIGKP